MILMNKKDFIFCILSFYCTQVFAIPESNKYTNFISDISLSGPADAIAFGQVIGNSGSTRTDMCSDIDLNYTLARIDYEPILPFKEVLSRPAFSDSYLYEVNVPGLSVSPRGGYSPSGGYNTDSLPPQKMVAWQGSLSNADRIGRNALMMTLQLYIYKDTSRLTSGTTVLPSQKMYRYVCYDNEGKAQEIVNILSRPVKIISTVTGCTPINKAVTVNMDKIPVGNIKNADPVTLIGTKKATFSLQCDPGIFVYASFVDLTDPTNRTDVANLTSDSTASGVGYVITGSSGKRLLFGPDGSASGISGKANYLIQTAGSAPNNNPVSTTLGFSYVRKSEEELKTGTAKAMIGITYSYH